METSDHLQSSPSISEAELLFAARDDQGSVMEAGRAQPLFGSEPPGVGQKVWSTLKRLSWLSAGTAGIGAALLARSAARRGFVPNEPRIPKAKQGPERKPPQKVWTAKDIDRAIQLAKREKEKEAKRRAKPSLGSKVSKALLAAVIATLQGKLNAKALQRASESGSTFNSPSLRTPAIQPSEQGQPVPVGTRRKPLQRPFSLWGLIRDTFRDWTEDKAARLGAALAYYTVFSIAPLLVIVLAIAGYFLGPDAVQGELHTQLSGMLGEEGATGVEAMIAAASKQTEGLLATIVSVVVLLLGATGVFTQMKDSLNTIWEVQPKPDRSWWGMIKDRFLSFAMVLGIAFLLLVSLVVSTALGAVMKIVGDVIPGPDAVAHVLDVVVSIGVTTLLFALIFKYLPDVRIRWKDIWIGALVTAVLFAIGKYAIGMYLGNAALASSYGAAASVIIVMLWAYYSSQILFFGAEFIEVYASMTGRRILPDEDAVPLTPERDPKQQPVAA
jgi:membrane protein